MLGTTPMFKQYDHIKEQYQDEILFYRLGDFYEMFGPDAERASRILGLALTARDGGEGIRVPMCGVPFHSADTYIAKLIAAGEKVAICEQMEDPKSVKGLVKRDVVRVITPGMFIDDKYLKKDSNYMAAIVRKKDVYAVAIADTSTGEFLVSEPCFFSQALNEMDRYHPVEVVVDEGDEVIMEAMKNLDMAPKPQLNGHFSFAFQYADAERFLKKHFEVQSLSALGLEDKMSFGLSVSAAGALLDYIQTMQHHKPRNITNLSLYRLDDRMILDRATRRNLEITEPSSHYDDSPTLYQILDRTQTAFGKRLLRSWLEHPLTKKQDIEQRLNATAELYERHMDREVLTALFQKDMADLERIASRISYRSANPKDLIALKKALALLPDIKKAMQSFQSDALMTLSIGFDTLDDAYQLLEAAISNDAPFGVRDGGIIQEGWHEEIDELRQLVSSGESWINDFIERERSRTGIKNLKIGYNKVFGYFIDVTKSHYERVPSDYQRKQTLANSERYITDELKAMETKMIGASERLKDLEYEQFMLVMTKLLAYIPRILSTSHRIAHMDVYMSLAKCALEYHYVKPKISEGDFHIKGLRHAIVERTLLDGAFTANTCVFDKQEGRFIILTGPNMSGKSTYCRSIALAVIMMQVGSFVPAEQAEMCVFDRVFARIGANDHLASGQSTFMVEMNEVSNILNNATADSLVILDEVGRGTSTYDGLSIAYAITRYINDTIKCFTIFATHYHELTVLAEEEPGIVNYSVKVKEEDRNVIFMHSIVPGATDKSYGVHVAKMAGLPNSVLNMADDVLRYLEKEKESFSPSIDQQAIDMARQLESYATFISALASTDVEKLSVGELLNSFIKWQAKARNILESQG